MAKILVVDDETQLADLLAEVVSEHGHEAFCAYNGRDALALARREQPELIITDVMMPYMSGVELLKAIREDKNLRHTHVALISAAFSGHKPTSDPPADIYLAKPFDLSALDSLITKFLPE